MSTWPSDGLFDICWWILPLDIHVQNNTGPVVSCSRNLAIIYFSVLCICSFHVKFCAVPINFHLQQHAAKQRHGSLTFIVHRISQQLRGTNWKLCRRLAGRICFPEKIKKSEICCYKANCLKSGRFGIKLLKDEPSCPTEAITDSPFTVIKDNTLF